ncbi:MAG: carbamoyl-phosphate synthase large subunit [Victivallaceae bacterium]|nr:carbamoyl-phosphate synthase large subunit [Victivallaceae bacterium]
MPKRQDIQKVLIIGSGPIIIGQACEFDYSGTQACKALRSEGYEIVLVNSNPATIMTDPGMADHTYIEPLTVDSLEKIIAREKPDALLPNLGGQTGLNLATSLSKAGILTKYNVKVIGVDLEAIERGEDRIAFKATMNKLGVPMAASEPAYTMEEAEAIAAKFGYPVVLRPAYTMGGTGGGIVYNVEEMRSVVARGLEASLIHQVLVEECVKGWEELELEVVRDQSGDKITVCFIENVDPMGVHTGDSFCVAPMLTVPEELQKRLQDYAYRIIDEIGIIGGCNVQFAHCRETDRIIIIEINPRTSRSSALASKATGFPIASVSTRMAAGILLREMPYWRGKSLVEYKPWGDYVVVKFARWAFEKFPKAKDVLGTQMKAVGEVMSIGKNFKEAAQKAIRSLEIGRAGFGLDAKLEKLSLEELKAKLAMPSSKRYFYLYEAMKKGLTVDEAFAMTQITRYFLEQLRELALFELELSKYNYMALPDQMLIQAKVDGFSDKYLAKLFSIKEKEIRDRRIALGVKAKYCTVPVSGVEHEDYYYSTYALNVEDDVPVSPHKKVMILGGGPNRIGQGIEFDYTCVHAAFALRDAGYESIMVNCNPETVSTDYDTSNKLYFEPLTLEDVLAIYEKEKPEGVIVQFGGQTPLNIAQQLKESGVNILGTQPEGIRLAEDREYFRERMIALNIPQPESGTARSLPEAVALGNRIGYPVMVRPSFVLGGRGMEVIYDEETLKRYAVEAIQVSPEYPMLIDRFLDNATESELDAVSDGKDTFVATVMEHIELAGIHSGDSACTIPPITLKKEHIETMERYAAAIARDFKVEGILNVQYAVCRDTVYIIEANPRASRTVPIVSKITGVPLARIATGLMLGRPLADFKDLLVAKHKSYYGVKEAVFPFNMFPEVDPLLGPEMRATGEVMGIAPSFELAYYKSQQAAGSKLPLKGTALVSVNERERKYLLPVVETLHELGFKILATEGTAKYLDEHKIPNTVVNKINEARPNITDLIKNNSIQLIFNTPQGRLGKIDDSYIRMMAIQYKIPYMTTIAAAKASVAGIKAAETGTMIPKSLQEYQAGK